MASDNIAGATSKGLLGIFLFPGKVWQWFMYMGVGSVRGYGQVRSQTRLARSPIMTWIYSVLIWLAFLFCFFWNWQDVNSWMKNQINGISFERFIDVSLLKSANDGLRKIFSGGNTHTNSQEGQPQDTNYRDKEYLKKLDWRKRRAEPDGSARKELRNSDPGNIGEENRKLINPGPSWKSVE